MSDNDSDRFTRDMHISAVENIDWVYSYEAKEPVAVDTLNFLNNASIRKILKRVSPASAFGKESINTLKGLLKLEFENILYLLRVIRPEGEFTEGDLEAVLDHMYT